MRGERATSLLLAGVLLAPVPAALGDEKSVDTVASPPVAEQRPHRLEAHGDVRVDPYYWLREREAPEVRAYLDAENAYTKAVLADTEALQQRLFEEIVGRIKQEDVSVPYKLDHYYYYYRYEEGSEYPIYCRKKGSLDAAEEEMLDANELAAGHEFFSVRGRDVSSGEDVLAYAVDTVGRRFYALRFKNLTTGVTLPDVIPNTAGISAWAGDNRTIFYVKQDPQTLRWHRVYRHELGTKASEDVLVYEETDETFRVVVWKTKSKRYLAIGSFQTLSSEVRLVPADDPTAEPVVFAPREREHEYDVDHYGDSFYIRTNLDARNFRLMKTPVDDTRIESWSEVLPHRDDVFLSSFEIFKDYLVLSERKGGLVQLRIRPWSGEGEHYIDFGEPAYSAYAAANPEFDTPVVRYEYSSLTTPWSTYDYNMATGERQLKKRDTVLGGFESADYETERLHASARDGTHVPISIVYRRDARSEGGNPLLLYGYGSYGASLDASFRSSRLSLLDRGFAFAIAHVRGGQELGRAWYEEGKLLDKKNTFTDFVDCGRFLVAEGYTKPDRLFAMGGSAGGLLMGAVANMAPDLFHGILSQVPFVDVVTTMLDPDIPLTSGEWDEWGDPRQKEYYDYILSYSPYDNIEAMAYPHMLVTTSLEDSQVQYWEPAKYVAKLRATKTGSNRLLLKTNMGAGHGGTSGRLKRYRDSALEYGFLLDLAGIEE